MKVFLSSTAEDLKVYRQVADDTILRLQQQSVAMERFGPRPDTPVEECERLARESDVVVCIVAHRYGFIPEKGRGSITRREVEAAHNAGKDVLVWIVDDNYPWTEKKEQDLLADPSVVADPAKVADVAEGVAGLLDFKAWLRKTFTPEKFTTSDDLGRKIAVALVNYMQGRSAPATPRDQISIARLPTAGAELFGREDELKLLDDVWANPNINILSFVAWGGVGKTALINHWLKRRMARDNYRGADRIYAWSFFSQGTREQSTSADLFIDQALRWFGDADPSTGTPWDKGQRLARYIRQSRTLLILDGLEPLQHPPGPQEGFLKDAALQTLLVELSAQQPGLCVISTRERIADLVEFGTVVQHDLEHLSPKAGAQILRSLHVAGDDRELEDATEELKGHALSVTLLGSYVEEVLNGDIRRRQEIQNLFDDARFGTAAQRMISAYEDWLGEGPEIAILRLLAFFDRPVDRSSLEALFEPPPIPDLTEPLHDFEERKWNQTIAKLHRLKLLTKGSSDAPPNMDAHPLLREYFKQQLISKRLPAWREGNARLYRRLRDTTKEFPDTVEEMSPLYAAVAHACAAGLYEEAFIEVYWRRILRQNEHFSWQTMGTHSADLAMLSGFFAVPWSQPVTGLTESRNAFLFSQSGLHLRALGRSTEAVEPMRSGLELYVGINSKHAGIAARNLSELYVTIGDLRNAVRVAEQGVELADRFGELIRQVTNRAVLANAMHQLGRSSEAEVIFREAEELQKTKTPLPFLYSVPGFYYCDLLLADHKIEEVKNRGSFLLHDATRYGNLLSIALGNLILGQCLLVENQRSGNADIEQAEEFLQLAVTGLRQAGMMDELPRGLLSSSVLYRFKGEFTRSEEYLVELKRIVTRGGMHLRLADYFIELARLRLAQNKSDEATTHLVSAKEMIDRMGYHRRDQEVAELEAQLG
jgi:tetratricopeptide (TPR) repeat protein